MKIMSGWKRRIRKYGCYDYGNFNSPWMTAYRQSELYRASLKVGEK